MTLYPRPPLSAIPPKADICSALADVGFVPIADILGQRDKLFVQDCRLLCGGSRWRHIRFIGVGSMSCSAAR